MKSSGNVPTLIERYFSERLMRQRNVSANTIASYRDTFRLLFTFAQARLRKPPSTLALDDLSRRRALVPRATGGVHHVETCNRVCVGAGRDRSQCARRYAQIIARAGRWQSECNSTVLI